VTESKRERQHTAHLDWEHSSHTTRGLRVRVQLGYECFRSCLWSIYNSYVRSGVCSVMVARAVHHSAGSPDALQTLETA